MKVRRRYFNFVAFWDEVAWVAGATTYNSLAQGETLEEAVKNLREQLWLDALWAQTDGKRPFEVFDETREPMKDFCDMTDTVSVSYNKPSKEVRYRGEFVVEWNPKHVLKEVKPKGKKRKL